MFCYWWFMTLLLTGCKMYIPESSDRNNNNVYEEISIPATTQNVPDTGPLVAIDSLDEIGQMGFQVDMGLSLKNSK